MKNVIKLSILLASIPLMLTACEDFKEKKAYCLETSDGISVVDGKCYQASRHDILESVFVINPAHNPEEENEEKREYDIVWSDQINTDYFSCIDGLKGKQIISILKLGPNILKVNIDGNIEDQEATFGYIKINRYAYKALNKEIKDAYLYAYVALGTTSSMVDKPSEVQE